MRAKSQLCQLLLFDYRDFTTMVRMDTNCSGVALLLHGEITRQSNPMPIQESTLLILEIPKANDKVELAAEQLFASLHGILRDKQELKLSDGVQEHLSFEIASVNGQIRFYVWVPKNLQSFVEGQIYSQYPTVQIHAADEDYVTP